MATELFYNANTSTTLNNGGAVGAFDTAVTMSSNSNFVAITGVEFFRFMFNDSSTEICICTNISGTTWTITRGVEGTNPTGHADSVQVMPVMTAGGLGSMFPAYPNDPTQYLNGNGVWARPLLVSETHTASISASLDFTNWYSPSYDQYLIQFIGVYGTGGIPEILFSTNGGSTWDTATHYMWTQWVIGLGDTGYHASPDSCINLADYSDIAPGFDASITGTLTLTFPGGTTGGYPSLVGVIQTGRTGDGGPPYPPIGVTIASKYNSAVMPNAFQFKFSSCPITAGTIRISPLPK